MYFKRYKRTYNIFSWLKPITLNKKNGKHKIINKNILKNKVDEIKLTMQKTKIYQTTLTKAVE